MADIVNDKYKIIKIAENNVETTPIKTIKDTVGKDVKIYDTDNKKSYGQDRIDEEIKSAQAQIDYWDKVDTLVEKKKHEDELVHLSAIQTEMDKELEEPK